MSKQSSLNSFFIKQDIRKGVNEKEKNIEPASNPVAKIFEPMATSNSNRSFLYKWLEEFKWLDYDKDSGIAKCRICNLFPAISEKNSKVVLGIRDKFKIETLKIHDKSKSHKACVEAMKAQTSPEKTPMATCMKKIDAKMFKKLDALFTTAYYIAKNNKPFTDITELVVLLHKFDVEIDDQQYVNDKRCKEFISHISTIIRNELLLEIKQCSHVTFLLDGSTDKATTEELVIYVRYLKEAKIKETFLTIVPLENASADGYLRAFKKEMEVLGIDWCLENWLVGVGTDGAAAMVGREKGLVTKMRENVKSLISQHCVAHKLNLSVLNSLKDHKYLSSLDDVLKKIYKFYQYSPKRLGQLGDVAEVLKNKLLKFQYLHQVRWVSSKVGVLNAMTKNWKSVVVHLENLSNENNNDAATAKGLLKNLKQFRFVKTMHFLSDFLNIFKSVSLVFQRSDLILSQVSLHIKIAIASLENLKTVPGSMEKEFLNNVTSKGVFKDIQLTVLDNEIFVSDKLKMIQSGIEYLEDRFVSDSNSVSASTAVFDTFSWPSGVDLENYGKKEILILSKHFCKHIGNPDDNQILSEWYEIKILGRGLPLNELATRIILRSERFPIISKLITIVAVLPTSTAACERGFSLMNVIKNKFRSNLTNESLKDLMTININGPSLQSFNASAAVDHWYFSAKTTRHVQGHKRHASASITNITHKKTKLN